MNLRIALVLVFATSTAYAQPKQAPKQPVPLPQATDDMAAFDRELDALFVKGGLTADQAAARAPRVSPTVQRRIAELHATIAQAEAAELSRVPQVTGNLVYTRLSPLDPVS